jgi:hypothetical protein
MNGINNNGIGYVFGQKTSSKNNKYTSVTPQKNIYQSTNSPIRQTSTPVIKETRVNDIRNYQPTKTENVNSYSVPTNRSSNDLRNTQPPISPTKVEYSSPSRNITEPKVNTYTPSERNKKPERVNNNYTQPQRQEPTRQEPTKQRQNYSTPSRVETPRRQESPRISPNQRSSSPNIQRSSSPNQRSSSPKMKSGR